MARHFVFVGRETLESPLDPAHAPPESPPAAPDRFEPGYRYIFHRPLTPGIDEATLIEELLPSEFKAQGITIDDVLNRTGNLGGRVS